MGKTRRQPKDSYDIYKSIRRDWGGLNPVTRIKESDKIYSRKGRRRELDLIEDEFDYSDCFEDSED
jgi:hypothetical protein